MKVNRYLSKNNAFADSLMAKLEKKDYGSPLAGSCSKMQAVSMDLEIDVVHRKLPRPIGPRGSTP